MPLPPKAITAYSTPQDRFNADPAAAKDHQKFIAWPAFNNSVDAVMAEYCRRLAESTDVSTAGSVAFKLAGAQEFIQLFKTFAEPPPVRQKPPGTDNLTPTDKRRS